jgi:hypothetical protein
MDVTGGGDFTHVVDRSWFNQVSDDWEAESNTFIMLLGIHAAQYWERIEARKVTKTVAAGDNIIRDCDKLKVQSSMTIVIPA